MSVGDESVQGAEGMSFQGYLLGGLIRVGYSRRDPANHIDLRTVEQLSRAKVSKTIPRIKSKIREAIRQRYTYRGGISIKSRRSGLSAEIKVRGPRENIKKFQVRGGGSGRARKYRTGSGTAGTTRTNRYEGNLYVSILRGSGGVIKRGFKMRSSGQFAGTYWRRDTQERLPIHMLYGPSVAEMGGKTPEVSTYIERCIAANLLED